MKLSVIMGIAHMTIGVIIKGSNTLFHRDYPSFFFEVVAGLIMLLGLFGWMDILIFAKWFFKRNFTDYEQLTSFNG
jgi:V-type H+-transporting ATPase subunit a